MTPGPGPGERRRFIAALAACGAAASVPRALAQSARILDDPFTLGVASGYPLPDGFMLWTRLAPRPLEPGGGMGFSPIEVRWEVAADESMRRIVASGAVQAVPAWAHSAHVEVKGLEPARSYWYRFTAAGARSPVGRTRTAPAAGATPSRLRYVLASCQHYEQGFFGVYRHIVADDPDLVVFVGDYIYEQSYGDANAAVRRFPARKAHTLSDYRAWHALYKTDPDLQAAHAACPWILTWDDHEVENDYANDRSFTLVARERFLARRAAAYKAYYEHMPLRPEMRPRGPDARIHTRLEFGSLARFHVLDDRQYRTPQPCPRDGRGGGNYLVDCAARTDSGGTMLGAEQERWFEQGVANSPARWNLITQQTLVSKLDLSLGDVQSYWTDGWDGYPLARQRMLEAIERRRPSNPVFLGGDMHMFWVAGVPGSYERPHASAIASEFVGTSVTSRSLMKSWYIGALISENPDILFGHSEHRGYTRFELTPERLRADLRIMDSVLARDAPCRTLASFVVENGRPEPRRA